MPVTIPLSPHSRPEEAAEGPSLSRLIKSPPQHPTSIQAKGHGFRATAIIGPSYDSYTENPRSIRRMAPPALSYEPNGAEETP